jgi:hypothetical protein
MAEGGGGARDLLPHGEALRSALRWLDQRVRDEPGADRMKLVGEAALRFDLTRRTKTSSSATGDREGDPEGRRPSGARRRVA